jgi:hypothetical protein
MPLMVASRALIMAQNIMQDVEGVCDRIPEAEQAKPKSKDEDPFTAFVVKVGTLHGTTVRSYQSDALEIAVRTRRGRYELAMPGAYLGPGMLPEVSFAEKLNGKPLHRIPMQEDEVYGTEVIERCWRIATVAAVAMKDVRVRIQTGRWPI